MYVCMYVCVCVHVCERERKGEKEAGESMGGIKHYALRIFTECFTCIILLIF
jgi:hypothetical protein